MKYVVTGKAVLTIGIVVDAESQEEAFERADEQFEGISFVRSSSGTMRGAELRGANEFFEKGFKSEFDEACTLEEYEHDKFWKGVKKYAEEIGV